MTEITPWQAQTPATVADYQTRAVQRLTEWVHSADAAFHVAQRLVQSSFVPAAFRDKPIEATAAILAGSEVGLSPMSALRSFDIIQGQAAPRAITLRAIVQSFGHVMTLTESTATRCIMVGRRRGETESQRVVWTLDRAQQLGLTGKDQWKKQPQTMLVARATSELARLIAADAILGIGYTAEELTDGVAGDPFAPPGVEDTQPPAPAAAPTRTMSRKPRTDVDAITPEQLTKLHVSLNANGITDRDRALALYADVTGRAVESSKSLTKAEASQVIDRLERPAVTDAEVLDPEDLTGWAAE